MFLGWEYYPPGINPPQNKAKEKLNIRFHLISQYWDQIFSVVIVLKDWAKESTEVFFMTFVCSAW